jgi:D-xylose transport system permease protein
MSSVEAPVVTVRAPLTPRLVELLSGEWRYVPILTAIALIWIFFGAMDPKFLSPRNLSNLSLQSIVTGTLALGLVPVLIIRQIDMSVAAVSGSLPRSRVSYSLSSKCQYGLRLQRASCSAFLQARWITWTRAPGFLVTFGVSLILAAVQLRLLPKTGQINLFGTDLTFLAGSYVHKSLSWGLVTLAAAAFAVFRYLSVSDAMKAGLHATILKNVVVPTLAVLLVVAVAVAALNAHNGVPVALLLFILAIIVLSYVGSHTRFGIYLYAAGSNPSAVVRAGIKVDRIRIAAFMICGGFAAFGGILAASRLLGVSAQSSGMGTLLLEAITAAVVGGTSLFGGRGSPWSALFGALAITSISNGIDLLGLGTEVKLATQGVVLILATSIDSVVHNFSSGPSTEA